MQKPILILVGLVIVGGGVWYFTSSGSPTEEATTNTDTERTTEVAPETTEPENLSGFGSLGNIMGFGDNVRCEFTSTFEGQTSEGTLVTDSERFRLEATITDPESGTIMSNIINDGTHTYTWGTSPEGAMAFKMANQEFEAETTTDFAPTAPSEQAQVDFEQQVEYDCNRWSVDNSAFVPPSDVEFMDMEAMMQEALQGMPEGFEMPEGFPTY
jgi:hypothetical protein